MLFLSNSVKTLKKSTVTNMSSHIFRVLKVAAFMLALFPCMHFKRGGARSHNAFSVWTNPSSLAGSQRPPTDRQSPGYSREMNTAYGGQSEERDAENGAEGSDEFSGPSRRYCVTVADRTQRYLHRPITQPAHFTDSLQLRPTASARAVAECVSWLGKKAKCAIHPWEVYRRGTHFLSRTCINHWSL